ncbi:MAG: hypothetical protein AAGM22_07090 [Acidobacteriota bacterium]
MRRFSLLLIVPTLAILALSSASLIDGSGTLYHRDFLTSHLPLKAAHANLLTDGHLLPTIDPYRSGGQPLLGNPNALPLYPTNVFFFVASPLWAMNAHVWVHWLLAPFALFWLARAFGLSRPSAWAAGAIYATSGYFLSLFNLYNLIAAATWTPALVAACLEARRGRPGRWPAAGALWTLIVLGGDPLYAALAGLMALSVMLLPIPGPSTPWTRFVPRCAVAFGLGTAVTLPMIVEMLRILPASFRGHWRYSMEAALAQSWDPRTALEWLMPFFFGPLSYDFWGREFFGGNPPLLYALYPGTLALVLVIIAGRPRGRRMGQWAWGWIAVGGFLTLGIYNPAMWWLYRLPGASVLRYPIKAWLLVAVAASLLAGLGLERALREGRGPLLRRLLGIASLGYLGLWLLFLVLPAPFARLLQSMDPATLRGPFFAAERLRWLTLCFFILVTAAALWFACRWLKTKPGIAVALLVAAHVASQCFLLQPLYDSDDTAAYTREPALLAHIGEDQHGVHGAFQGMFGNLSGEHVMRFPDRRFFWLNRENFTSMGHFSGTLHRRRYDFNHSPEGLDTFVNISLTQSLAELDDAESLRVLAASGVDRLFMHRPLEGVPEDEATLLHTETGGAWDHSVYAVERPAPHFALAGRAIGTPHLNAALEIIVSDSFDARTTAVVRSIDLPQSINGESGRVEVVENRLERLVLDTESGDGGVLLTRRAWLPTYRATIDGEPVATAVVNIHKLGVVVPAGEHRVEIWIDRGPTRLAVTAALLSLFALAAWAFMEVRRDPVSTAGS